MSTVEAVGVREGDLLAGKYRIDRVLGVGGMGVVVLAHHLALDEQVAIKFLLPALVGDAEAVVRFAREARAAVKIKSEHVARVSDVGQLESGAPYMVMEYLEGSDLAAWLSQSGALPVEQAIEFVLHACEALAEAHALGIVHRDLKPGNLFVVRRPDGVLSVKVLDFGISKLLGATGSPVGPSMTKTSAVLGSPLYMSPEQLKSARQVDARSDIWALGVILYELLSGSQPFQADSMTELVVRVGYGGPPPALRVKRAGLPEGLEQVVMKCLEKEPEARYQSVGDLAVALLPFGPRRARNSVERIAGVLRSSGFPATTALPPSSGAESRRAEAGTAASWGKTLAPRARSVWLLAGVVAVFLGAGALAWRVAHGTNAREAERALDAGAEHVSSSTVLPVTSAAPAPVVAPEGSAAAPTATAATPRPALSVLPASPASSAGHARAAGSKRASPVASTPHERPAAPPTPPAPSQPNIFEDRK